MSEATAPGSSSPNDLLGDARERLTLPGWSIDEAADHIPAQPGLYAIHAAPTVWEVLGVEFRPSIPLYVGKAQKSLAGRDLQDHFASGSTAGARTGGSTVRRTFAALLSEQLDLRGVPRNLSNPERFNKFGLLPEADERLTAWMHAHLTLVVWKAPVELPAQSLTNLETLLIREWRPPLNIAKNPSASRGLRDARAVMAAQAAAWRPSGD